MFQPCFHNCSKFWNQVSLIYFRMFLDVLGFMVSTEGHDSDDSSHLTTCGPRLRPPHPATSLMENDLSIDTCHIMSHLIIYLQNYPYMHIHQRLD